MLLIQTQGAYCEILDAKPMLGMRMSTAVQCNDGKTRDDEVEGAFQST